MLWWPLGWCLSAGAIGMALKQRRGASFTAADVFGYVRLYPKLLIPGAMTSLLWTALWLLLYRVPGNTWLIMALESLFAAPCLFVLPLHVDQKLPFSEAAMLSLRTIAPVYPLAVVFHLWAGVASTLGVFLAFVGILLSWHIPNLSMASAYLQTFEPPKPKSD